MDLSDLKALAVAARKAAPGDWKAIADDTGGEFTGWPSIVSEEADAAIVHRAGFKQEYWGDWSMRQADQLANYIAASQPSVILELIERLELAERGD